MFLMWEHVRSFHIYLFPAEYHPPNAIQLIGLGCPA